MNTSYDRMTKKEPYSLSYRKRFNNVSTGQIFKPLNFSNVNVVNCFRIVIHAEFECFKTLKSFPVSDMQCVYIPTCFPAFQKMQ